MVYDPREAERFHNIHERRDPGDTLVLPMYGPNGERLDRPGETLSEYIARTSRGVPSHGGRAGGAGGSRPGSGGGGTGAGVAGAPAGPADVQGIAAGQQGQFGVRAGPQVQASGTYYSVAPEGRIAPEQGIAASGRYYEAPTSSRALPGNEALFGNDLSGDALQRATYELGRRQLQPAFDERRAQIAQSLVDRGVPVGSEAYERELDRYDRRRNEALGDLALRSVGAGRAEQSRILGHIQSLRGQEFDEDLRGRQFSAREQARRYAEELGAARERFGQNLEASRENFSRRATSAQINAAEQGRRFQEGLAANRENFDQQYRRRAFDAAESARRFDELSRSQAQTHGINLANRQFEESRDLANRQLDEGRRQFDLGYGLDRDRLGESRAGRLFSQDLANQQLGEQRRQFDLGLGESRAGRIFGQDLANRQFEADQTARQVSEDLARQGLSLQQQEQAFYQRMARLGFDAQQTQKAWANRMAEDAFRHDQELSRLAYQGGVSEGGG